MAITLICPNLRCRAILQVPENVRGRKVRCGNCGNNFMVPDETQKRGRKGKAEPAQVNNESN